MHNFKMIVSYDGTNYHGWQLQNGQISIQQVLETAVQTITGEKIRIIGSGRTDSGVHALGQVAHFKSKTKLTSGTLKRAINSKLPSDIRILKIQNAPSDFHSRFWAKSKIYRYQIWNREDYPVMERNHLFVFSPPLNVAKMHKAAKFLLGKHDFSSFGVKGRSFGSPLTRGLKPRASTAGKDTPDGTSGACTAVNRGDDNIPSNCVRRMKMSTVLKKGPRITIQLEADGFLYKMVRSIVGTLLDVGLGKLSVQDFRRILQKKDRSYAGRTVPPQGLTLVKVKYKSSD